MVMEPIKLVGVMQSVGAWKEEHFKTIATYDVNYKIQWRNSQTLNRNGEAI